MKYTLNTHPEITVTDPTIEVVSVLDLPQSQTFTPMIQLKGEAMTYSIAHELPAQPYVNGTWDDADVMASVENYLKTIAHD
jgi:hypothetical protein